MSCDLNEFIRDVKADLSRFEMDWRQNHSAEPDNWPMVFASQSDWLEQFIMHLDNSPNKLGVDGMLRAAIPHADEWPGQEQTPDEIDTHAEN